MAQLKSNNPILKKEHKLGDFVNGAKTGSIEGSEPIANEQGSKKDKILEEKNVFKKSSSGPEEKDIID